MKMKIKILFLSNLMLVMLSDALGKIADIYPFQNTSLPWVIVYFLK